jgi:hypothetical protein
MVYSLKSPRRKRRATRRRNPRFGFHRPTLVYTHSGWKRPRRRKGRHVVSSHLFPRPVRINAPKRHRRSIRRSFRRNEPRRRFSFRRYRRNPALPLNLGHVVGGGLKIAGGVVVGMVLMPVLVKFMPKEASGEPKFRKFYGVIHVLVGAAGATFIKQKDAKEICLVVAGTGLYDLIASNLTFLGLPTLADTTPLLGHSGTAGEDAPAIGSGADYAPAQVGASYGASYGADDIAYGDDGIEID